MKAILKLRILIVLFALALSASCKNPNATQETDGKEQPGPTPEQVDSASTEEPGGVNTSSVPKDAEGDNSTNDQ